MTNTEFIDKILNIDIGNIICENSIYRGICVVFNHCEQVNFITNNGDRFDYVTLISEYVKIGIGCFNHDCYYQIIIISDSRCINVQIDRFGWVYPNFIHVYEIRKNIDEYDWVSIFIKFNSFHLEHLSDKIIDYDYKMNPTDVPTDITLKSLLSGSRMKNARSHMMI